MTDKDNSDLEAQIRDSLEIDDIALQQSEDAMIGKLKDASFRKLIENTSGVSRGYGMGVLWPVSFAACLLLAVGFTVFYVEYNEKNKTGETLYSSNAQKMDGIYQEVLASKNKEIEDLRSRLGEITKDSDNEKPHVKELEKLLLSKQEELASLRTEYNNLINAHEKLEKDYKTDKERLRVSRHIIKTWQKKYNVQEEPLAVSAPEHVIEGKVVGVAKNINNNTNNKSIGGLFNQLKDAYYGKNDYEKAEQLADKILDLDPNNKIAWEWKVDARNKKHNRNKDDIIEKKKEEDKKLKEYLANTMIAQTQLIEYPDDWLEMIKSKETVPPHRDGGFTVNSTAGMVGASSTEYSKLITEEKHLAKDNVVRHQMKKKITFEFREDPLERVLGFMSKVTGIPIVIDPAALTDATGTPVPKNVTLRVDNMRTETALNWILNQTGLIMSIKGGTLVISKGETGPGTEQYEPIYENPFMSVFKTPLSTFSIDVDTASYSNIRRFIEDSKLPPKNAVRIEEMVNYFRYDYPQPKGRRPFSIYTEVGICPWNPSHQLVHIGLQGRTEDDEKTPDSNLVFLLDVSGSMKDENKLPLVKETMSLLVYQLRRNDRVAIVTYNGNAQQVLGSTSGKNKREILEAIEDLQADGSTAGEYGLKLAYKTASGSFLREGNNRIILATDGDFNVGVSDDDELVKLIEKERKRGIFLTILGFGTGNIKDAKLEKIANKGNGHYAYIDSVEEGRRVMLDQLKGTLHTIAKDVKIQIEFNPANVKAYRLIGYENRLLENMDFHDDTKDAGELGEGHTVTALYEIVPSDIKKVNNELRYQKDDTEGKFAHKDEFMNIKLRYKNPSEEKSDLITYTAPCKILSLRKSSDNFRFSAAVAEFGLLLRDSRYKGNSSISHVIALASDAKGKDERGYRDEFITLAGKVGLMLKNISASKNNTARSINSKVIAVNENKTTKQPELVMLSVGRQDGVKVGYEFVLYRGETYLCKVVIKKVFEDSSVGRVIPESVNTDENGKPMDIRKYDSASTQVF